VLREEPRARRDYHARERREKNYPSRVYGPRLNSAPPACIPAGHLASFFWLGARTAGCLAEHIARRLEPVRTGCGGLGIERASINLAAMSDARSACDFAWLRRSGSTPSIASKTLRLRFGDRLDLLLAPLGNSAVGNPVTVRLGVGPFGGSGRSICASLLARANLRQSRFREAAVTHRRLRSATKSISWLISWSRFPRNSSE